MARRRARPRGYRSPIAPARERMLSTPGQIRRGRCAGTTGRFISLHFGSDSNLQIGSNGHRHTVAPLPRFSYTIPMTRPLLSPGSADALLFDLDRDEAYKHHEIGKIGDDEYFASLRASLGINASNEQILEGWNAIFVGEMPGMSQLLARASQRLPLYAFSNTNSAHVEHFSQAYADVLSHFREMFLSSAIGLRKPDAAAYDHVVKAIGVPAARIVFFDDLAENIEGARARGLTAVHVTSPDDVAHALAALGI